MSRQSEIDKAKQDRFVRITTLNSAIALQREEREAEYRKGRIDGEGDVELAAAVSKRFGWVTVTIVFHGGERTLHVKAKEYVYDDTSSDTRISETEQAVLAGTLFPTRLEIVAFISGYNAGKGAAAKREPVRREDRWDGPWAFGPFGPPPWFGRRGGY